jgi:hypothetical protein
MLTQEFRSEVRAMDVTPGQRFRKLDLPYITWEVTAVLRGSDARLYARLHRVGDRATEKTLACGVLKDRKLFHLVAATKA